MSHSNPVPSFDLLPRDTLCQCVSLLRLKWQPGRLLGPRGMAGESQPEPEVMAWRLTMEPRRHQQAMRDLWQGWLERDGMRLLAPHVLRAAEAAGGGAVRELRELDRGFDRDWPPAARHRSQRGAEKLLEACDGLRHGGVIRRLRDEVGAGRPCHWATAWAALGSLFSLPPTSLALAALMAEWEALEPLPRRRLEIGEAVARFARDSGSPLARCRWMERRVRQSALRIA